MLNAKQKTADEDSDAESKPLRAVAPAAGGHIIFLPPEVVSTILTRLDAISLFSVGATCKFLNYCFCNTLPSLPSLHLTEIAPTLDILRSLLGHPNPHLASLRLDCGLLDDSAIDCILRPSLEDLHLVNCGGLSGKLLTSISQTCIRLRFLTIVSLGEERGHGRFSFVTDILEILIHCPQLESLCLAFDLSVLDHPDVSQILAINTVKLSSLKLGYLPAEMIADTLYLLEGPGHLLRKGEPMFLNLQKLSLSVDYITDDLIWSISKALASLTHLSLQDSPLIQPDGNEDLTNVGLQQINLSRKLKDLSLVRRQEFSHAYFERVNDLGLLLMAEGCSSLESICLGGFCHVTDTGFRAIVYSCPNLLKLEVVNGPRLSDLVFHDISATPLGLTHISLRKCNLLTHRTISKLSLNYNLSFLDLRDCRSIGDEALQAISSLPKLVALFLDGTDTSDLGLCHIGGGSAPLVTLSLRCCRRLTDQCIFTIFRGVLRESLQMLDLSDIDNITDNGILFLAKSGVALKELRLRNCHCIGDTSVMALASMQINGTWQGSSLQLLDLYGCKGISLLVFRWFKKPYFPRLRWLGLSWSSNRYMVDALARTRYFLRVVCSGEELGDDSVDTYCGCYSFECEEMDELEQWSDGEDG